MCCPACTLYYTHFHFNPSLCPLSSERNSYCCNRKTEPNQSTSTVVTANSDDGGVLCSDVLSTPLSYPTRSWRTKLLWIGVINRRRIASARCVKTFLWCFQNRNIRSLFVSMCSVLCCVVLLCIYFFRQTVNPEQSSRSHNNKRDESC